MSAEERRKQPESLRLRAVLPFLTVSDLETSLAFYRDILGFTVVEEFEHEGQRVGASVRAGAVDLMLGQDDWAKGRNRQKGVGFRLYCTTVQGLDQIADGIKARGGELETEPTDQPWGARDFSVVDPDGFKISVSTEVSRD